MPLLQRVIPGIAATLILPIAFSVACGSAFAQGAAKSPGAAVPLQVTDLRVRSAAESNMRTLWQDRLAVSQKAWSASTRPGQPNLPAYTLSQTFVDGSSSVLISILDTMFDCEAPGNGAGADLFLRCPMRVVSNVNGKTTVKEIEGVCFMWVPKVPVGQGPDASANYTTASLDASRTLRVRVVQFGRPTPQCDLDIALN